MAMVCVTSCEDVATKVGYMASMRVHNWGRPYNICGDLGECGLWRIKKCHNSRPLNNNEKVYLMCWDLWLAWLHRGGYKGSWGKRLERHADRR
jgi:hypothetical protein